MGKTYASLITLNSPVVNLGLAAVTLLVVMTPSVVWIVVIPASVVNSTASVVTTVVAWDVASAIVVSLSAALVVRSIASVVASVVAAASNIIYP